MRIWISASWKSETVITLLCRRFRCFFQEFDFFYCNTFQIVLLYLGCRKWQPEYPGVAQMVARLNGVQEAAGSNPVTRTIEKAWFRKKSGLFRIFETNLFWRIGLKRSFDWSLTGVKNCYSEQSWLELFGLFIWQKAWSNFWTAFCFTGFCTCR